MEFLRHLLLVLHLLGMAALFGGLFIQMRSPEKKINSAIRDGAGTAFLAGLLLVGVIESQAADGADLGEFHAKIAVKLVVALIILVLAMANLKKPRIPEGLYWGLMGLTVANVCIAVFWTLN